MALTDLVLKSLLESQHASSIVSKWEYRPPHFPVCEKKTKAGFELSAARCLAGGGAFFLANREVREIKNAAFW